ncbi:MAG TPA: hypothetical protein VK572_08275, partial [Burkholderiales bacterium]|nr:hypothetical protein [Burkholderiales bacterium]
MKSSIRILAGVGLLLLLSACAVGPVAMNSEFWSQTDRGVGVAVAKLPEAMPHKVGSQGLLDIAINNAMADELSTSLKTVDLLSMYGGFRDEVTQRMKEKGMKPVLVQNPVDTETLKDFSTDDKSRTYAAKDFRPLKAGIGNVDRLLLVTVVAAGTQRPYYGFIPTGRPTALLRARGELIDLNTNEVLWRDNTMNVMEITDPWDRPPNFANVHAAVKK